MLAVLHDLDLVREHFPQTLLLARRPVAWGAHARDALQPENLLERAGSSTKAATRHAPWCEREGRGMSIYDAVIGPFAEFEFMRRALIGTSMLSLSACPVGVFLMLRRMSLSGDAMAHAILPGAAVGFLVSGLELLPMTFGGLVAGIAVALALRRCLALHDPEGGCEPRRLLPDLAGARRAARLAARFEHRPDARALRHRARADNQALILIGAIAVATLVALAFVWRALVAECMDPVSCAASAGPGRSCTSLFWCSSC